MSECEKDYLSSLLTGAFTWIPNLETPQTEAFWSPAFEVLYGGAAGGGKSDLLLGLARHCHQSVLLLRREYPDLERSLIERSRQLYQGNYNGSKHVWRIGSRRIEFGHLQREADVHQYQSAQYDLIGFDELTQFSKLQYEYLLSRARTTIKGQRVRVVGCTNPGGEGNDWVMERWAAWLDETHTHPAKPGELRWYKRDATGREIECSPDDPDGLSRTFIPARLVDNPYLGDEYRRQLNALPEPYRSQLLNGDWQAGLTDDAYQVIPTVWIKQAMARWTSGHDGPPDTIGADVARGGDDQTVFARRHGKWFAELERHPGRSTPDGQSVAGLLAVALAGGGRANVDVIGVGSSAFDIARMLRLDVSPVNFAAKSEATDKSGQLRFVNLRAEAYWRLREALDPETGDKLALPNDPELLGDLRSARWQMQTNGIKIEDKEDIKKRLGRSPDSGDAVVLAWLPAGLPLLLWGNG